MNPANMTGNMTLDASRTVSYEITHVRLSVGPSLSFIKIGSLADHDI